MKHKFIRKVVIYLTSVLIVGVIVGGGLAWKEAREQAALEATYAEAKPVMTQEEMEALYDEHKKDRETGDVNSPSILEGEDAADRSVR